MQDPAFWSSPDRAKVIAQQVAEIRRELETWDELEKGAADLTDLASGLKPEEETEFRAEIEKQMAELEKKFKELEFLVLFLISFILHLFCNPGYPVDRPC